MTRDTMSDGGYETGQESGRNLHVPASDPGDTGDRRIGSGCCGTRMGGATAEWPCGSLMRNHPVVLYAMCALMGLAVLVISAGVLLRIIAFLRAS